MKTRTRYGILTPTEKSVSGKIFYYRSPIGLEVYRTSPADNFTIAGDLRAAFDAESNHEVVELLRDFFDVVAKVTFDAEYSCFFAHTTSYGAALRLAEKIDKLAAKQQAARQFSDYERGQMAVVCTLLEKVLDDKFRPDETETLLSAYRLLRHYTLSQDQISEKR